MLRALVDVLAANAEADRASAAAGGAEGPPPPPLDTTKAQRQQGEWRVHPIALFVQGESVRLEGRQVTHLPTGRVVDRTDVGVGHGEVVKLTGAVTATVGELVELRCCGEPRNRTRSSSSSWARAARSSSSSWRR